MKYNIKHALAVLGVTLIAIPGLFGCSGCVSRHYSSSGGTTTFGSNTTSYGSSSSSSDTELEDDTENQLVDAGNQDEAKPLEKDARDWWFWRGPEYNGISRETGLPSDLDFSEKGFNWRRGDLGGRSTPVTLGGKLYTIVRDKPGTAEEGEKVVCVDMNTGKTKWENRFNVWLSDVPDTRVGWSSVLADPDTGRVYALGVCGYFQCLDGETGETLWAFPLHEKFGFLSTYGGRTNFPVICDDVVIISAVVIGWGEMAKPGHRFVAFDKKTGQVVWFNGTRPLPYDTTYSSPTVTVLGGQKALVFGSGDGAVWAFQPRTGKQIWKYRFSRRGLNVSPLVDGDMVYSGHSEENVEGTAMGAVVAINGTAGTGDVTKSGEKWKVEELMAGKSSPIKIGDVLYCFDDRAKLYMLDTKTGEDAFRRHAVRGFGTIMRASPLYADGKIYAFSTSAWQILEQDEKKGVKVVNNGRLPEGEEVYASPIVSHGKLYLQTTGGLYCFEDDSMKHGLEKAPAPAEEAPVEEDEKPALVQVIPAELLIRPGRIKTFKARVFNSRGQLLDVEESEVEFSMDGPGDLTEDGTFLAPSEGHVALTVKAKVGDLEGRARVRVVPDLPWEFNFDDADDPPITWVGARYRHVIREVDGSNAMVKVTTIPKGTRSRCWFGHSDLRDYTMQADVRGQKTDNGKLPDIGLLAQGYAFDLQGENQVLEIRTWGPHDFRTKATIDFPWEAEKWYTMKFRAENQDGNAVLKGKAWPRGEDEPAEWNIEVTDPVPNEQGSPGLFGNAKDAELYLDNISVTDNSDEE